MKWIINEFPDDKSQRNIREKDKKRKERKESGRQVGGQREDEEDREREVGDKQRE